ncbi:MAG: hypothetical protein AAGI46_09155 [Planctomycetota bacterium]
MAKKPSISVSAFGIFLGLHDVDREKEFELLDEIRQHPDLIRQMTRGRLDWLPATRAAWVELAQFAGVLPADWLAGRVRPTEVLAAIAGWPLAALSPKAETLLLSIAAMPAATHKVQQTVGTLQSRSGLNARDTKAAIEELSSHCLVRLNGGERNITGVTVLRALIETANSLRG